jgi:hypothetical protein
MQQIFIGTWVGWRQAPAVLRLRVRRETLEDDGSPEARLDLRVDRGVLSPEGPPPEASV